YDLVLVDGAPEEYPHYVDEAVRLLRLGGIVALVHALAGDRVSDPTQRDPQTVAVPEAGRAIRDHGGLVPAMLPTGAGVLAAVRRAEASGPRPAVLGTPDRGTPVSARRSRLADAEPLPHDGQPRGGHHIACLVELAVDAARRLVRND